MSRTMTGRRVEPADERFSRGDSIGESVCFAQAWHWLDPAARIDEIHRVLRPGGRWAGWWSHARADGQRWFDDYWGAIERSCPGTHRE